METIEIQGIRAEVARSYFQRARGLIGRQELAPGTGMLILHCNAIHTCFMKFPIDAIFLDRHGNVVKTVRNIRPWRLFIWGGWRANRVLEVQSRK